MTVQTDPGPHNYCLRKSPRRSAGRDRGHSDLARRIPLHPSRMSEDGNPDEKPYADASPFQAKQKAPLLERAVPVSEELKAYGSPLHPTGRAAVEAAGHAMSAEKTGH
jgi:hypothetical protein